MSRLKRLRKSLIQFPDIGQHSSWLLTSEARAVWELRAGVDTYSYCPAWARPMCQPHSCANL